MPISQKSLHVMLHLFLVYISWGSTYIGYKFSLGVAGPFLVGGSRMVIGGILLALFLMLTGRWIRPERKDWIHATWMGVFMVLLASGFLAKGRRAWLPPRRRSSPARRPSPCWWPAGCSPMSPGRGCCNGRAWPQGPAVSCCWPTVSKMWAAYSKAASPA